jgi:hypothetical protein
MNLCGRCTAERLQGCGMGSEGCAYVREQRLKQALVAMVYVHPCQCGDGIPAGSCARCRAVRVLGFDPADSSGTVEQERSPEPTQQAACGAEVAAIREALNVWTQERALAALDRLAARIEEVREGERNWQKLYYESRDRAEAAEAEVRRLREGWDKWQAQALAAEARIAELEQRPTLRQYEQVKMDWRAAEARVEELERELKAWRRIFYTPDHARRCRLAVSDQKKWIEQLERALEAIDGTFPMDIDDAEDAEKRADFHWTTVCYYRKIARKALEKEKS